MYHTPGKLAVHDGWYSGGLERNTEFMSGDYSDSE